MGAPATFLQVDVERAIKAAEECGKTVYACDVTRDGIRLIFERGLLPDQENGGRSNSQDETDPVSSAPRLKEYRGG